MHLEILITGTTGEDFGKRLLCADSAPLQRAIEELGAVLQGMTGLPFTPAGYQFRSTVGQSGPSSAALVPPLSEQR